jgi:hypothetical protein
MGHRQKHVVSAGYERILQLVHTREAGQRKVLAKAQLWGCIGDVALENTDIPNDRAVCCHRSGVRSGGAYTAASKHRIVVRYGLDER